MTKHAIPAVILVGGKGARMGGVDKPLLTLAGRTLLDQIIARLHPQVSDIALATPQDPSAYSEFGLTLLPDAVSDQGPLTGLSSGISWAKAHHPMATHLALIAGDTPFLPVDLIARLANEIRHDATCIFAKSKQQYHYSTGLWPLSSQATLKTLPEQVEDRSLKGFAHRIGFHSVEWTDDDDPFFNINTPDDLAQAEARIKRFQHD